MDLQSPNIQIPMKFLVVGSLSTILNYLVFATFFLVLNFQYLTSFTIGFLSGVALGYILNRSWTFQISDSYPMRYFFHYTIVYITSLLIGLLCMRIAVEILSIHPLVSNIGVICITTCTNYSGIRFWVFKNER